MSNSPKPCSKPAVYAAVGFWNTTPASERASLAVCRLGGVQAVAPELLQVDARHRTGRRAQRGRRHQRLQRGAAQQHQGFRNARHLAGQLVRGCVGQLQQARGEHRV